MKIISNKTWKQLNNIISKFNNEIVDLKEQLENKQSEINNMLGALQEKQSKITDLEMKLGLCQANLKADENVIKELNSAKGGFTKRINQLTRELEETKKKLEESLSDAYLRVKVPMGKLPKGQVMKMKSHAKQDKIIKKIYDDLEKD